MPGNGGFCSLDEDSRSVTGAWLLRVVLTRPPYYLHVAMNAQKLIIKTPCQSGVSTTILTPHKRFKYCGAAVNPSSSGGSKCKQQRRGRENIRLFFADWKYCD